MKNRELIEQRLFDNYLEKDVNVILRGGITTEFTIHSAKILLSDNTLIITNTKREELLINFSFVTNTTVDNAITFELEEQKVTLDY